MNNKGFFKNSETIVICSWLLNSKTKANFLPICCSLMDSAKYLILNTAFSLMWVWNLKKMRFSKCGSICIWILKLVVFADIWTWPYKVPKMTLAILKMTLKDRKKEDSAVEYQKDCLEFRELKYFNITLHICLINLLNQLLGIFMCCLEPFQGTDGRHWRASSSKKKKLTTWSLRDCH